MATRNRRSNREKLMKRRKRRRLAFTGLGCVLLALCYLAGNLFFQKHFFPGTTINGVACGMKTVDRSFDLLSKDLDTYELKIISEEGELPLKAKEVGLKYTDNEDLIKIMNKQEALKWPLKLTGKKTFDALQTQLDDDAMKTAVEALACMHPTNPRESENATIAYNKDSKQFEIVYGSYGNIIKEDAFLVGVKESMLNKEEVLDLSCNKYYKEPKYTSKSDKINQTTGELNQFLELKIHYEDGDTTLDVSKDRMSKFLKWDKDYNLDINEDAIGKYVKDRIAKKFDETESLHIINTPSSGKVYVAKGENGQRAVDVPAEKKRLIKAIKEGKDISFKPTYVTDYLYSSYGEIIQDDYVDINLGDQKVSVVLGGKVVVDTPCVTGNTSAGRGTPTGIYRIAFKTTEYTMVKYNAFVHYWMPYDTSVGIGLHDATWRSESEFGGNTYTYNGSHGCVNLPLNAAAKIYQNVYTGMPVMVHW